MNRLSVPQGTPEQLERWAERMPHIRRLNAAHSCFSALRELCKHLDPAELDLFAKVLSADASDRATPHERTA